VRTLSKRFSRFRAAGIAAAFALASGSASNAWAGASSECHFHGTKPASEAVVIKCAGFHKDRLIKKGTIDATWSEIKHESVQQVDGKEGKKEWKVTFKDAAAKDKSKETLYMFFSEPGNLLASNFSGK